MQLLGDTFYTPKLDFLHPVLKTQKNPIPNYKVKFKTDKPGNVCLHGH